MINLSDVKKARSRIDKYINKTPLEKSIYLSDENLSVYLKLENQQKMKCAKLRGALSKLTSLNEEEIGRGIVAVSSGNHGAAVSYAGNLLGIDGVTIYVPETSPKSKLEKIQHYGADLVRLGKNYDEAHRMAMEKINDEASIFIDPCSDEVVIAGQGTIALEILEENPDIDTILVPIGGGGIITGISIAAKGINPKIKVIGLQTAACPAMVASLKDNQFYESYPTEESICDALVGGVGYIPYTMAKDLIDEIIIVEEKDIARAVKHLLLKEKLVVEAAGAIGVAALMANPQRFKAGNVGIVLTGGNIDDGLLKDLICDN